MNGVTRTKTLILLATTWLIACNESPAPRLLASRVTTQAALGAAVGADCNRTGRAGCKTQLCLHTSSDPGIGHVCSAYCKTDKNCPVTWQCKALFPGQPENGVCLPPRGFQPGAVAIAVPHQPSPARRPGPSRGASSNELTDGGAP